MYVTYALDRPVSTTRLLHLYFTVVIAYGIIHEELSSTCTCRVVHQLTLFKYSQVPM